MDESSFLKQINTFKRKNDWNAIANLVNVENLEESHLQLWNNAEVLSELAFAYGRLSVISLDEVPTSFKEKSKFLDQKAKYREFVQKLYQRCCILCPDEDSFFSGLGYLHYQNVFELAGKIRVDGKTSLEVDEAIQYFDQALLKNPGRIKDHYRKGYLLAEYCPRFTRKHGSIKDANSKRKDGISSLKAAVDLWEVLNISSPNEKREADRCRSEYVKSLYRIGLTYHDMVINQWDEVLLALGLLKCVEDINKTTYLQDDWENVCLARKYLDKCHVADSYDNDNSDNYKESYFDRLEKVDKLYSLGKVAFTQYWVKSEYGQQKSNVQANQFREEAEAYLAEALECPWSSEKENQNKAYIAERIGRLYITSENYQKAIDIINQHKINEPYVIHTLALARILAFPKSKEIQKEIQKELKCVLKHKNKFDIYTTHFLMACSHARSDELDEADEFIQKALGYKEDYGVFALKAILEFKRNNHANACDFLNRASELKPSSMVVKELLKRWKGKLKP